MSGSEPDHREPAQEQFSVTSLRFDQGVKTLTVFFRFFFQLKCLFLQRFVDFFGNNIHALSHVINAIFNVSFTGFKRIA